MIKIVFSILVSLTKKIISLFPLYLELLVSEMISFFCETIKLKEKVIVPIHHLSNKSIIDIKNIFNFMN